MLQLVSKEVLVTSPHIIQSYDIYEHILAYLTSSSLSITNVLQRTTEHLDVGCNQVARFKLGKTDYIAILYVNWVLEIRKIANINMIIHRFPNIAANKPYPILQWNAGQVYLVYQTKIEIFNIKQKERKQYSELLAEYDNEEIVNVCFYHLLQNQRIIVMLLKQRLLFNLIPITVADLYLPKATHLFCIDSNEIGVSKEYLGMIIDNHTLAIYNFITMKRIYQNNYQVPKGGTLEVLSNHDNKVIILSITMNKMINNILLRINDKYYFSPHVYQLDEEEPFFHWQLPLPSHSYPLYLQHHLHQHQQHFKFITIQQSLISISLYSIQTQVRMPQPNNTQQHWEELEKWKDMTTTFMEINFKGEDQSSNPTPFPYQLINLINTTPHLVNLIKPHNENQAKEIEEIWVNYLKEMRQLETDNMPQQQQQSNVHQGASKNTINNKVQPIYTNNSSQLEVESSQQEAESSQPDLIQSAIERGMSGLVEKVDRLCSKINNIQEVHLFKLNKIEYIAEEQLKEADNLSTMIKGYCRGMISQVSSTIEIAMTKFYDQIDSASKHSHQQHQQTFDIMQKYIQQQIQHRSIVFEASRTKIERSLGEISRALNVQIRGQSEEQEVNYDEKYYPS